LADRTFVDAYQKKIVKRQLLSGEIFTFIRATVLGGLEWVMAISGLVACQMDRKK
jgi:hypothetical protein